MRKRAIAVGAVLSLGLTACGSGTAADEDTLTVWIMEGTNPDSDPFFDELGAEFEKRTGAALTVQYVPWPDAHDKFTKAMAGGTTPDVAEIGTTWTTEFAEAGALAPLGDRVRDAGLDGDLVEGLQQAGTLDGELYGMPWYAGVRALLYRKDLFDEHGLTAPTSWDELRDTATALKRKEPGTIPFPVVGDNEYALDAFIWGAGGDLAVERDGTWKSAVNSPAALRGLKFYTSLATEHGTSPKAATTWDEADLVDNFADGRVAMAVSGSWTPAAILADHPELEGRLAAAPIPGPDGGTSPSFLGGSHLGIFEDSGKQDLAWEFVALMSSAENAEQWARQSGYFAGQRSLVEKVRQQGDPLVAPFARQLAEAGRTVPTTPAYGEIQGKKTLARMVQSVLTGRADPRRAADRAAADMDESFGN